MGRLCERPGCSDVAAMAYGQHDVEPDPPDVAVYEAMFQGVYRRLYPAVAPLSHTITDLQRAPVVDAETT